MRIGYTIFLNFCIVNRIKLRAKLINKMVLVTKLGKLNLCHENFQPRDHNASKAH